MPIILFPVICIGLVVVGHWWSNRRDRARRLAGIVPIAALEDGQWAMVTGVVGAVEPPMTSPLLQRSCIGFRLLISEVPDVAFVLKEEACAAFSLEDGTGTVAVDGPFQLELEGEGFFSTVPDRYGRVIEKASAATRERLRVGEKAFFREALLAPGDRVTVVGLVLFQPDPTQPAAGFRSPSLRARLCGSKDEPIVVAHEARPPA